MVDGAYLKSVESGANSRGRSCLIKHLKGERLTQRQAIHAKCYDCMGHYQDGRVDCKTPDCPLYPWMAYKGKK